MSKSFSNSSFANSSFAHINGSFCASEYITNKKQKYTYYYKNNKNNNNFNKSQLYTNLYTNLNLTNIITIIDLSGNSPLYISNGTLLPYNNIIDPSGNLFGNTPCGLNNYLHYLQIN